MLSNKRRPRKSQLYSVEACRVRIIIQSLQTRRGWGWQDIVAELRTVYKIKNVDEDEVRKMVLGLK